MMRENELSRSPNHIFIFGIIVYNRVFFGEKKKKMKTSYSEWVFLICGIIIGIVIVIILSAVYLKISA